MLFTEDRNSVGKVGVVLVMLSCANDMLSASRIDIWNIRPGGSPLLLRALQQPRGHWRGGPRGRQGAVFCAPRTHPDAQRLRGPSARFGRQLVGQPGATLGLPGLQRRRAGARAQTQPATSRRSVGRGRHRARLLRRGQQRQRPARRRSLLAETEAWQGTQVRDRWVSVRMWAFEHVLSRGYAKTCNPEQPVQPVASSSSEPRMGGNAPRLAWPPKRMRQNPVCCEGGFLEVSTAFYCQAHPPASRCLVPPPGPAQHQWMWTSEGTFRHPPPVHMLGARAHLPYTLPVQPIVFWPPSHAQTWAPPPPPPPPPAHPPNRMWSRLCRMFCSCWPGYLKIRVYFIIILFFILLRLNKFYSFILTIASIQNVLESNTYLPQVDKYNIVYFNLFRWLTACFTNKGEIQIHQKNNQWICRSNKTW